MAFWKKWVTKNRYFDAKLAKNHSNDYLYINFINIDIKYIDIFIQSQYTAYPKRLCFLEN